MGLQNYRAKRDLKRTPEPRGTTTKTKGAPLIFVVQRHKASHLHYDFRLEMRGTLKSWAVPKGPSMDPKDKRLAMMVEDHPFDYKDFAGLIPEGNYGAGIVEIWDRGTYAPLGMPEGKDAETFLMRMLHGGSIKIVLKGKKLRGEFALVRMKGEDKSWLLIKHRDRYAVDRYNSEDETPKNSPINKFLASSERSAQRRKGPPGKSAAVKSAAPVAMAVPMKRFSVRGMGSAHKVKDPIRPMLASGDVRAFDDPGWLFEIKWDGYRAMAETGKDLRFYSRNGLSFLNAYPEVVAELYTFKRNMVLDGELVAINTHDRPDFQLLQHAGGDPSTHVVYYVFDLLELDGKDLTRLPLVERKRKLKAVLSSEHGNHIRYCDHVMERGIDFFAAAVEQDLEGIIGKRADSTYHKGVRGKSWVKIKHHHTQEAVIGGYTAPRNSRKHFGALLLGVYRNDQLVYAGHTGTGFDARTLDALMAAMKPLVVKTSPFSGKVDANMPPVWVKPQLVCNVKFTEWTRGGHMRHPVFLGLRADKAATDVRKEPIAMKRTTKPSPKSAKVAPPKGKRTSKALVRSEAQEDANVRDVRVGRNTVHLTNLNKLYWPTEGITKGDVLRYYEQMHTVLLPHLKDRPESLFRTPNGIVGPGFFQKDAGGAAPAWVPSVKIPSDSRDGAAIDYLLCNDLGTLLYMVNLGCIEINPWSSRKQHLLKPDHLVMDLDPSDRNTFDHVVEAALAVKVVLDRINVKGHCKTSGSSGLHIYIPTGGRYTYEELAPFAKNIMLVVQRMLPDTTTLERSLAKRDKRKIYLDHLQNRKGQTIASVYSVRPKPGATVSTPLKWNEVKPGLDPKRFTIGTVPARVKKLGDLFKGVLEASAFDLKKAQADINSLLA
jgi:bifunctional non-homologous end joining protein LigD